MISEKEPPVKLKKNPDITNLREEPKIQERNINSVKHFIDVKLEKN